jgi:hypothetical protein
MTTQPTSEISCILNVPLTITNVHQNSGIITENMLGAKRLQQPIINVLLVMDLEPLARNLKISINLGKLYNNIPKMSEAISA